MNAKVEKAGPANALDVVMTALAVLLLGLLASVAVGAFTKAGRSTREYLVESQFELRKVVWPTRQETIQTTIVILIVVIILSIILWLIDMFLGWVILEKLLKARI